MGILARTLLAIVLIPFIIVSFLINVIPFNQHVNNQKHQRRNAPFIVSSVIGTLFLTLFGLIGFITIWATTGIGGWH